MGQVFTKYLMRPFMLLFFYNHSSFSCSAQLTRSLGENFQGEKLVSMFWNIAFHCAGELHSSIAAYRRSSKIMLSGSILTGQASTQVLQLVQALITSLMIYSFNKDLP